MLIRQAIFKQMKIPSDDTFHRWFFSEHWWAIDTAAGIDTAAACRLLHQPLCRELASLSCYNSNGSYFLSRILENMALAYAILNHWVQTTRRTHVADHTRSRPHAAHSLTRDPLLFCERFHSVSSFHVCCAKHSCKTHSLTNRWAIERWDHSTLRQTVTMDTRDTAAGECHVTV